MGGGKYETQMCVIMVEDIFGKIVAKVLETVLKESCHLPTLLLKLKGQMSSVLNRNFKVRKALSTLINFGFVSFSLDTNNRTTYVADADQIQYVISAPRACLIAKTLHGPAAESICVELISQGRLTVSETIRRIRSTDESVEFSDIKHSFEELARAQFLIRVPAVESNLYGCPQLTVNFNQFEMPKNIMEKKEPQTRGSSFNDASSRKRKADASPEDMDAGQYWRINWARFNGYLRDELIIDYLIGGGSTATMTHLNVRKNSEEDVPQQDRTQYITQNVAHLMFKSNELRANPLSMDSITVSITDLQKLVRENELDLSKPDIELACQILVDESDGIVRKVGDSNGGLYTVDIRHGIRQICRHHCESLIREQFEGRAIRVMRLLESRHYLDEEQVEKLSMMSGKEAREMLYALVEEGYVFNKPVGRSNDFQPARTFYLYYVDLPRTIRGLVEYTCKLVRNLILRQRHERTENKALLDKDANVQPIIENIRASDQLDEASKLAQIAEVEEMYLPGPDRAQLNRFRKAQATLLAAQDQSIRVLLAFKLFLASGQS
ncbi:Protein CBG12577 [Caenorhabditis briggsae]|uniref:DNA-directed RNA polymerase III subunit RPC3 n=1 Tax=Caenorhabditis briggsae TaxID=6238 RepID=A8XG31_CAEBR|nr:Protein CBG12577 [Caenorhabditis briggsae]CAP31536.2 Protein CBG12577 [Caenorhabditis briggsae]